VSKQDILLATTYHKGKGTGHIRRLLKLAFELGKLGKFRNIVLCVRFPQGEPGTSLESNLFKKLPQLIEYYIPFNVLDNSFYMVVIDSRATNKEEYNIWAEKGPVVALDEGGEARHIVSYVIDTFPVLKKWSRANVFEPAFLPLPEKRNMHDRPIKSVLVSFGGEDPAGLSIAAVKAIYLVSELKHAHITVVSGPLSSINSKSLERAVGSEATQNISIAESPNSLIKLIDSSDMVCTSFGLTAYESVTRGVPVILLHPSGYHKKLSKRVGFPELPFSVYLSTASAVSKLKPLQAWFLTLSVRKLRKYMAHNGNLKQKCKDIPPAEMKSLSGFLQKLVPPKAQQCPVCEKSGKIILRMPERTFLACTNCSLEYQVRWMKHNIQYSSSYFFEEYKQQYGKTYLEDFRHIQDMAKPRLRHIKSITEKSHNAALLDVGCAYGPFLYQAQQWGFVCYGNDVAHDAVGYVKNTLGIPADVCGFTQLNSEKVFERGWFDAITMWYVIEHFENIGSVLEKVSAMLKQGGVFAFSTPNSKGISRRTTTEKFYQESPADHYTLWSPKSARRVLKRYGLKSVRFVSTGHHPERFTLFGHPIPAFLHRIAGAFSKIFFLGDTFEVYAVKQKRK